jgi:hypothetical protein
VLLRLPERQRRRGATSLLVVVLNRRLVKLDRDYRFGSSRRLLVARAPPAGQADMRLDCHFCFPWRSGVVNA